MPGASSQKSSTIEGKMIHFFTKPGDARVHVVEPLVALRSVIVEALRHHGFGQVTGFGDLKAMLDQLAVEPSDWVLCASCTNHDVNVMHLLKMCIEEPRLRDARVSLLLRDHEKDLLPMAFEFGLLSYHITTIPGRIPDEIADLLRILRLVGFNGTLVAANFLGRILKEYRLWDVILNLQKTLLEIFPGSAHILLALAEAELSSGREEGRETLQQILLLDPEMAEEVEHLGARFMLQESLDLPIGLEPQLESSKRHNALGIESCMLVDPDTSVHHAVRKSLKVAGIDNLEVFESGTSAWKWLNNGGHPSLILMEWRISDLSGLQLIQRIQEKFPSIPVVVVSSLVTQADMPLIRELGVRGIVEKPFETTTLMTGIVSAIQQHRYPTEQSAMDRRILHCLSTGNKTEASRLIAIYLTNSSYEEVGKIRVEAEFAFSEGRFQQCCAFAFEALKLTGDSVELLNLLGKALMKLGEFESALKLLEKANALAPKNVERICRLADLCHDMKRMQESQGYLDEAKMIDATNVLVVETEASIAILDNDVERAASSMRELDSLYRIVAYTNNKAVAKIRNDQFEEGINLYKTALKSLPDPWSAIHETLSFNLSLAYIRHSKYPDAKSVLDRIRADPTSTMGAKVSALGSKLDHAIRTQTQLQFAQESASDAFPQTADVLPIDLKQLIDSLVPVRGDICCYRVFHAHDLASDVTRKLLQNMPKLARRPPIRRNASLPHRSFKPQTS